MPLSWSRAAHRRVGGPGGLLHHVEGVLPHGVAVVGGLLGAAAHGLQLRQQGKEDPAVLPEHLGGVLPAEELCQLLPHPLRRQGEERALKLPQGPACLPLDGKAQLAGEAQTPQHPQGVLPKAAAGVPHTAQHTPGQVLPAPEGVHQAPAGVPGHGVHRKVPGGTSRPPAGGRRRPRLGWRLSL